MKDEEENRELLLYHTKSATLGWNAGRGTHRTEAPGLEYDKKRRRLKSLASEVAP